MSGEVVVGIMPTYGTVTSQIYPGPGHSWSVKTQSGSLYEVRPRSGALLSPFARADLLRGSHGLAVPSDHGASAVSLQRQHRRQRRALSLRRDTWARDGRLDGIGAAHQARHTA